MAKTDDKALQAALAQFNEGLKVQESQLRAQRAIDKADRKKQQAATALKKAQSDSGASGDDKAEAEANYRTAVDEWTRLRSGEPQAEPEPEAQPEEAAEAEASEDPSDAEPEPEAQPEEAAEAEVSEDSEGAG